MKLYLKLYGDNAEALIRELNLHGSSSAKVPMTASFIAKDVEGRAVVACSFESSGGQ